MGSGPSSVFAPVEAVVAGSGLAILHAPDLATDEAHGPAHRFHPDCPDRSRVCPVPVHFHYLSARVTQIYRLSRPSRFVTNGFGVAFALG